MIKRKDSYGNKHKIDLYRRFWWERLPILRHLATKRMAIKLYDVRLVLLMEKLGYDPEVRESRNGTLYIKKRKKRL